MPTYIVTYRGESAEINERGVQSYTREYTVESSTVDDSSVAVAAQLPFIWGNSHPSQAIARVKNVSVKQRTGAEMQFWDCSIHWDTAQDVTDRGTVQAGTGTPPSSPGGNSNQVAPNSRPWVLRCGTRERTVYLQKDRRLPADLAHPIINAAGQPFAGGLPVPSSNLVIHITAYKSSLSFGVKPLLYIDTVNDATFLGCPAGCCRCVSYSETTEYESGAFFWRVEVEIEVNPYGWNPIRLLNAGSHIKAYNETTHANEFVVAKDLKTGRELGVVPLSEDGTRVLGPDEEPNYIDYIGYYSTNFNAIIS